MEKRAPKQESFNSRNYFILAAIGSAVGLGNIWRFPYVAYSNGGGAFILPYLIALLSAGIPLLFFDYAIGHRYRGSAPLALRRLGKWTETLGWWQVMVCFVIALYYAAVVAWAGMYTIFSFTQAWGSDPKTFLMQDFLHVAETPGVGFDFVPSLVIPMVVVWAVTLITIALGVNKGLAMANTVFMPLLVVMFLILVVQSLFLPGAADGLNALFTPDWGALGNLGVWAAAFGQIFFSLSVGFGIMTTYASYLKRRTDLTGSGLVVGFANSGFELLAGIGVFAALGFMAQASGLGVNEVVDKGLTLAFVAFPTIISQAPLGPLMGVLFFGSLTVAGITSLLSIVEVLASAVRDKLGIPKVRATLAIGIPLAIISTALLSTTTALYFLDITDEFVNKFGILAVAFACVIAVAWIVRKLPVLSRHLDRFSSFRTGKAWVVFIGAIVPVALGSMLVTEFLDKIGKPYENYPLSLLAVFGWGMAAVLIVAAVVLTLIPWRRSITTDFDEHDNEHEVSE
ncbi:sodium-dependent transporter [Arachnia rubra]|uniref:Transporter n=1 Tax=Arachnia rubra TaxID=1547448 RepID=A0ABX7Y4G6_9ACTN|nr:sodium-dependent transporter [Arachnia rubra]MBB1571015.1 sodium-dependent transporter [Propionibacterium sp.]MDO4645856.1 sodium-dependent transporter [Propionibacteriaceae bacterium]MBB1576787.1 sodium-dependent transporter [Propionibacterium sp.]QUC08084.1 sodium-dependent transporter [Arachnia rubra]BCR82448.1 sodium-dependent transporter [Arachnia rubra]